MQWMIYGANGYTGELIAREAKLRGLVPILAGRSAGKVQALAQELGLECRSFGLDRIEEVNQGLKGVGLVLHCAGPFSETSQPMIEGCLREGAHYLDITGEIAVFEYAHAQHERGRTANIVICSGAGFDVIPTDCVAAALKEALPDATHLALGFDQPAVLSPGTAKTTVEMLGKGGMVRRDGKVVAVAMAYSTRTIDFGTGPKSAMTIPWGDVATAFYSTGIPNIAVYIPASQSLIWGSKIANGFRWMLSLKSVVSVLQKRAGTIKGPNSAARARMPAHVWGEVSNAKGEKRTARIKTANGYSLTITGSLHLVQFLLHNKVAAGSYTPSRLMGSGLVSQLPESGPMVVGQE